ncbi:MAG TPA: hypothetical protein VEK07_17885 [Polyangiaceae bacterium]|nr:hypothetical protein [Polyangiaceae bacterium]
MNRFHRSKWCASLLVAAVSMGCSKAPDVTTRTVTLHAVCAPDGVAIDGGAYAVYTGLGDFEPGSAPVGARLLGGDVGATLSEIAPNARVLFVDATESEREWWGVGAVPSTGNVDVLLVPALTSCQLPEGEDAGTPPAQNGAQLAAVSNEDVLVVGGVDALGDPSPTLIANLETGAVEPVTEDRDLGTPRTGASVTPFGDGALVAGGFDPGMMPQVALATAEVYDPALGGFDQQHPILLSEPRANQGAVVLASGDTLLVGGIGTDGTVLSSMEIVDPTTDTVRAENVASLTFARSAPTAVRLASGEILVAGGVDANGAAVTTMELFSSDASCEVSAIAEPVTGGARAYTALSSGGALFVIAPGPTAAAGFQNAWFLAPDGTLESAVPIEGSLTAPKFFGGAGGSPALWTGDRWLRWQPWSGSFGALGSLDDTPAQVSSAFTSADSGFAMWLDTSGPSAPVVTGLRFDTRGEYSTLDGPVLVADTQDVAPDRLTGASTVTFDPSQGLTLAPGASVFVTDRTYADVAVSVDMPGAVPALVVLRDESGNELVIGGTEPTASTSCPGAVAWCPGPTMSSAFTLGVQRNGSSVTWSVANGPSGTCGSGVSASARLSIGLRGVAVSGASTTESIARNLSITRLGAP